MTTAHNANPDFNSMASKATLACSLWRAWAQGEPKDSAQARRGFEVAVLYEKQAAIFAAMHRNRVEWRPVTKADAPKVTP
jgi:hypothetical protein